MGFVATTRRACVMAAASICLLAGSVAGAYTPSAADLQGMTFSDFGGGGSLTSIAPSGDGALLTMTLDATMIGFSRVAVQKTNFNANISGSTSFDVLVTNVSGVTGTKLFVQTGDGFQFNESGLVNLAAGVPTLVSLNLVGIPDLNNVRQFGFQFFGGGGLTTGNQVLVASIPEPTSAAVLLAPAALLLGRRRSN